MPEGYDVDLLEISATDLGTGVVWTLKGSTQVNANLVRFDAGGGVREHVNEEVDVLFVGVAGSGIVRVDGEEHVLSAGRLVFAPRGVPHAQRRVVQRTGRILVVTAPGGLDGFFRTLATADRDGGLGPDARAAASSRYGITWLDG